ncbi:MAG TPA: nucleotide exchange factor GrpE [Clostridiales bacterium]|nr:nucleotide exchange factor GrpE [Clostridiales bacterium]
MNKEINNDIDNNTIEERKAENPEISKDDLIVENEKLSTELENVKSELEEKLAKCDEYLNMLQRTAAEFDNFKKRTQKEKDALSKEVVCDTVSAFIPVADNLERAMKAIDNDCNYKTVIEGIELVYRQFMEVLEHLGVEEINCIGEKFNPELHNAVMHVDDEAHGDNEVVEVFQKGYIMKDKVIRHSVVKVAN